MIFVSKYLGVNFFARMKIYLKVINKIILEVYTIMKCGENMKQEVLDLYDNNFNKLGKTVLRRIDEIPENTNIMMSYILIKNNDKYLLEQSTERNNFKWAIPGGHVLTNEDGEQGLKRELYEELGLENICIKYIETIKFPYNNYIFNIYLTEDEIDINRLVFQPEEVLQVKWYNKSEILELIREKKIAKGYAFILQKYVR